MPTVLLTGAGGAAIPDLIRHLKRSGYRVLTCDMNPQAPGLYLGDGGFVVPPATDPAFVLELDRLCFRKNIDALVPLVDEELLPATTMPVKTLVPRAKFIQTCLDKQELMQRLSLIPGVSVPKTEGIHPGEALESAIVKPRVGRGSRGLLVRLGQDLYEFESRFRAVKRQVEAIGDDIARIENGLRKSLATIDLSASIVQEYIEGPEYTVSVVCDQANTVHAVVPKLILRKEGKTHLAVTRRNDKIDALCRKIAEALNPCGPFNVQLKLRDGEPFVFEINPRFSGTVNLTIAAGCDEVGGLIELALGNPYTFGEWKEGVVLVRQTHDGIMSEAEFNDRAPKGWDA